jgi:phosphate transport system permease protein
LSRWHADRKLAPLLGAVAAGSAVILLLVVGFVLHEAWPVLANGHWQSFLLDDAWHPLEGRFGLMPMLVASLLAAVGAALIAGPVGVASAVFNQFFATPAVARTYRMVLGLLAGIPSVVFGLWGLTVLVPLIGRWQAPGVSLLAAILILALMIIPTVALTSASALAAVPRANLHGAAALGLSRKAIVLGVAIPSAMGGIGSGVLLALARALGETMAVLMVAGNVVQFPSSLFDPVRMLTTNIALEMAYATGTHRSGLFASGVSLTLLSLLLAFAAAGASRGRKHAH